MLMFRQLFMELLQLWWTCVEHMKIWSFIKAPQMTDKILNYITTSVVSTPWLLTGLNMNAQSSILWWISWFPNAFHYISTFYLTYFLLLIHTRGLWDSSRLLRLAAQIPWAQTSSFHPDECDVQWRIISHSVSSLSLICAQLSFSNDDHTVPSEGYRIQYPTCNKVCQPY